MTAAHDRCPSPLLHREDCPVGYKLDSAGMAVERDAILAFARRFDRQAFHVDETAARESPLSNQRTRRC